MARLGSLRMTGSLLIAVAAGAVILTAVVIDVVRPGTPHPVAGPWYFADGRRVPNDPFVLEVVRGHEHCGWESVVFLQLALPPGSEVEFPIPVEGPAVRQYIRDPEGAVDPELAKVFDPSASLPEDARPAGFQRGPWRLYVSDSRADRFIYLVSDDAIEQWPISSFAQERTEGRNVQIYCT